MIILMGIEEGKKAIESASRKCKQERQQATDDKQVRQQSAS
jgi:hypothetical protein